MEMTILVPVLIAGLNVQSASSLSNATIIVPTEVPLDSLRGASTTSVFVTVQSSLPLAPINSISDTLVAFGVSISLEGMSGHSYTGNIYPVKADRLITPLMDGWITRYPDGILVNLPDYPYDLVPAYPNVGSTDPFYRTK
jgi:hypothetical protein